MFYIALFFNDLFLSLLISYCIWNKCQNNPMMHLFCVTWSSSELLACVVDLDLLVDVIEDGFHLVLQAVQLTSFPLQPPLVLLIVFLQLCGKQECQERLHRRPLAASGATVSH